MFALAALRCYFQFWGDERLPRSSTSCGRINTPSNGNHVWGRWNGLYHMKRMKYRPESCRAPITATGTQRGRETPALTPTTTTSTHTDTPLPDRSSHSTHTHKLPIWPFWSGLMWRRVWQWHLHSVLNSCFFFFQTCMNTTHTQSQRPWE